MKKRLLVTHTIKKEVEIEVDLIDFSLTAEQIDAHLTDVIESVKDKEFEWKTTENIECEWLDEPMLKVQIPDEYYYPFGDTWFATNGFSCFAKDSPIVFDLNRPFFSPTSRIVESIKYLLDVDFRSLPLHYGYFQKEVEAFKQLPNLEVRGDDSRKAGYFISNKKLIAVIMPLHKKDNNAVKFN